MVVDIRVTRQIVDELASSSSASIVMVLMHASASAQTVAVAANLTRGS